MFRQRDSLAIYLKPHWRGVALLAALLFTSIGLALVSPQIIRQFIDTAQSGDTGPLLAAAGLFLGIAIVRQALSLASAYVGERLGWQATNALREDLALHCLRLDLPFHKAHAPGELIERIDGDVSSLANLLSRFAVNVAGNLLLLAGVLVALWAEDWRVGLGVTIYAAFALWVLRRLQNVGVARWKRSSQSEAEHYSFLEERLAGLEDIRSSGAEAYVLRRLRGLARSMLSAYRDARLVSNASFVLTNLVHAIGYALGLGAGALLYTQGQITIGTAYLIVFYIALLAGPLDSIRREVQDLQRATASVSRIGDLLQTQPLVRDTGRADLPHGALSLEFDHVTFAYDQDSPALNEVSFSLPPGQVVGVLGRTGSGKSTLTRLLFRLYDPQTGAIRLDGTDTRDVPLEVLRERIAMVTQDVQLFQATIRDNLTLFRPGIPDENLITALQALGLWDWAKALPEGLDTTLSAGGHGLSAGEGQLLAFARAFLKAPGLVVLDEASSRLDPGTERLLNQAVDRLLRGRTGIIIAHRLNTVQRADWIAIFQQGRLAEFGRRVDLEGDPNSQYARLLRVGLGDVLEDEQPAASPDTTNATNAPDAEAITETAHTEEGTHEHVAV